MGKSPPIKNQTTAQQNDTKMTNEKEGKPFFNKLLKKQFIPKSFIRREKAKEAEDIPKFDITIDETNNKFDELDLEKLSFSSD
jgi:hypothetical protein